MRSCPALMFRCRSSLRPELRGRLFSGSFSFCVSDVFEAFFAWSVLAREVVDGLADRLSSSLLNLRFVVANAGWASVDAMRKQYGYFNQYIVDVRRFLWCIEAASTDALCLWNVLAFVATFVYCSVFGAK
jgi:hypothetical protein